MLAYLKPTALLSLLLLVSTSTALPGNYGDHNEVAAPVCKVEYFTTTIPTVSTVYVSKVSSIVESEVKTIYSTSYTTCVEASPTTCYETSVSTSTKCTTPQAPKPEHPSPTPYNHGW